MERTRTHSLVARYPFAGPLLWLSSIQYFVVQVVVASAWRPSYSWRLNAISDLGATRCGEFDGRFICSPRNELMNISLVVLGVAMIAGAWLLHRGLQGARVGLGLMAVAGTGVIVVGLVPLDTTYWAHIAGADVALLVGNSALIVVGCTLHWQKWFNWYSIASGVIALVALALFLTHNRFFLGLGGMERIAAYPQTIWLLVVSVWLSSRQAGSRHALPS
jgi:hypothetical membrane protein